MLPLVSGRLTHATLRALDRVNRALLPKSKKAAHLQTGKKGEEEAYFYLRKMGYVMVARNWRSPRRKGELDLVGWDGDVLCFIEVKTRTTRDVAPAEAAVDADKQRELSAMAQEFVRRLNQRRPQTSTSTTAAQRHGGVPFLSFLRASVSPWWKSASQRRGGEQQQPTSLKVRFDILSIYYLEEGGKLPQFSLFKNCFAMS